MVKGSLLQRGATVGNLRKWTQQVQCHQMTRYSFRLAVMNLTLWSRKNATVWSRQFPKQCVEEDRMIIYVLFPTYLSRYLRNTLFISTFVQRSLYPSFIISHFHDQSPSVIFISLFSCSFGQLPPSLSFHVVRFCPSTLRPRSLCGEQTKREPRNK